MKNAIFHYKRTGIQQALRILLAALLIPVYLTIYRHLIAGEDDAERLFTQAVYLAAIIGGLMLIVAVWRLTQTRVFEMGVTDRQFYSYHPVFTEWCFEVDPQDILRIEQTADVRGNTSIRMHLRNGASLTLCPNFTYSRKRLYAALQQVNPGIDVPQNVYRFTRKRSAATAQYAAARFPITSWFVRKILSVFSGRKRP